MNLKGACSAAAGVLLGGILATAGVLKLTEPEPVAAQVVEHMGLGGASGLRLVLALGATEVLAGLLLFRTRMLGSGGELAVVLLVGFVAFDTVRALSGDEPDCGCFSDYLVFTSWWQIWAKHAALLLLLALSAVSPRRLPMACSARYGT